MRNTARDLFARPCTPSNPGRVSPTRRCHRPTHTSSTPRGSSCKCVSQRGQEAFSCPIDKAHWTKMWSATAAAVPGHRPLVEYTLRARVCACGRCERKGVRAPQHKGFKKDDHHRYRAPPPAITIYVYRELAGRTVLVSRHDLHTTVTTTIWLWHNILCAFGVYYMVHGTSQRPTGRPDDRRRARPTATPSVIPFASAGKTAMYSPPHPFRRRTRSVVLPRHRHLAVTVATPTTLSHGPTPIALPFRRR
ncbi:Uncharacterized protein FWK35_00035777 [Aphis craccivora]|uniref:Uncharacterized protein n=1 Tax=Aphis craccivora TaxID=307492 RepID=A0A6G0YRJ4_APHCR|nr:Uncharacterized protein FWK35_00035777 [Aphis craccivora]